MQNWWDILGIERDAGLRTVKRAYAAKLKAIRQDEDPQGFMELRAAYDAARDAVRFREMHPEERQAEFGAANQDEPIQSELEIQAQDNAEVNLPSELNLPETSRPEFENDIDVSSLDDLMLPTELYASIVVQLVGEVEALMKSPWGANNLESWTALLDDSRLDDIDVFADFENAMLNYLLNIHGFHDEDANIPPKLEPAIAQLLFERFGWQKKRNSVHVNPHVFDWLTVKFFKPENMDLTRGDMGAVPTDIELESKNYTQNDYGRKRRNSTPPQNKSTQWFDGRGKFILIVIVVLIFIAAVISKQSSSNYTAIEKTKSQVSIMSQVSIILTGYKVAEIGCRRYKIFI